MDCPKCNLIMEDVEIQLAEVTIDGYTMIHKYHNAKNCPNCKLLVLW